MYVHYMHINKYKSERKAKIAYQLTFKVLAKRLQFKLFMHLTFSKHIEVVVFFSVAKI